ncbi:helix-turn-helix domain-containing protein [Streptomyces sp. NPDC051909]|uniref:helix-turn-helix domain-containing protein n=1 Tax=Streptomyces sp. NPDC051909 TaxID=3154944 RepID=UPI0034267F26
MTEVARTQGNSSEIERGVVPEVAELGNVLKELFNRLGITQTQYAYRVHLHKSVVSRFLGGKRLADPQFIERLVTEVETHVGTPLKLEAKEAIQALRLKALSVTDPDEFRLEQLRGELARSRRDAERADRNVEALHALLEKKEAEARAATDELDRLRLDWGAEIAALRQDLADAEGLRRDAERRGEELRQQVLRLENELSRRYPEGGGAGLLPLEAFQGQLEALWEAEEFAEAGRELTEAAWARPLEEAGELLEWLEGLRRETAAAQFVSDIGRLRPEEDLLRFAPEAERARGFAVPEAWATALSTRVTERNAAVFYEGLKDFRLVLADSQADAMLARMMQRTDDPGREVALTAAALAQERSPARLGSTAQVMARQGVHPVRRLFPFQVMLGLARAGRADVAEAVADEYRSLLPATDGGRQWVRVHVLVRELAETEPGDEAIDILFGLMAGLDLEEIEDVDGKVDRFGRALADDPPLLRRYTTLRASRGD